MRDNVISLKVFYQHLTLWTSRFGIFSTNLSWVVITIVKIQRFQIKLVLRGILESFCERSGENSHIKIFTFFYVL
jgi:hypothetical protein